MHIGTKYYIYIIFFVYSDYECEEKEKTLTQNQALIFLAAREGRDEEKKNPFYHPHAEAMSIVVVFFYERQGKKNFFFVFCRIVKGCIKVRKGYVCIYGKIKKNKKRV